MSSELLRESFFDNKEITASSKLMIALALSGAHFTKFDGLKETTCGFLVPSKSNPQKGQQVFITPGNPDALTENACNTILHGVGFDQSLIENILGASTSDKETVGSIRDFYRILEDTNKLSTTDFFEKRVEQKLYAIAKILKDKEPFFARNPMILENLIKTIKESYGSTKSQEMTEESKKKQ